MMHFLVHHNKGLSNDEILDELLSLVMAGHESKIQAPHFQLCTLDYFFLDLATANTLSFCLVCLAYHPKYQEAAREEVQQILSSSDTKEFSYEMLQRLPFLWQIFRETLRLFPTVPVSLDLTLKDILT